MLEAEVAKRTNELTEANHFLTERNEEVRIQNEKLEEFNHEILRQSDKILKQQEHIVQQNLVLEDTVEELKKSNQSKDRFFSILAHDLRNPVAALAGIAESLNFSLARLTQKEVQGYIQDIHKSSQNVYNLLINLLNWSKTQSSTLEHTPGKFRIYNIVQKNVTLLEQQVQNKEIKLSIDVDSSLEVFADYNMIDAIIRNLLTNSIKFTYKGGSVGIQSSENDEEITITITDNGIGMNADQLENLFKVEKNNLSMGTEGETGTGLGLIITREFIQANGGSLTVVSEEGKGSTFKIHLPKSDSPILTEEKTDELTIDGMSLQSPLEELSIEKLIKIKGRRILVIDDNKELRSHLKLMLSATFEIFEAENGREGLKMAQEVQPTAIICDMIMPVMSGVEFCKALKSNPATSHIPVLLLTSHTSEEAQLSSYGAGADIYLTKPVKKELLFQVILNLIQHQEHMRQKMMETNSFFPEDVSINKVDEEFINKVIRIIEENLSDPNFDYKEICDQSALSRTVLYTKIKTITGQGVHEFIKSIRLKKSLKLLTEGHSPSQVCFDVGFNSHSYFNKCFIKQYGKPPKEFVKKKKSKSGY
jgi:signal transduction histidine kinase/DNA-binding response OmpR family regulator